MQIDRINSKIHQSYKIDQSINRDVQDATSRLVREDGNFIHTLVVPPNMDSIPQVYILPGVSEKTPFKDF